mmetsp:Transcript_23350/g.17775  ORF Transcript_23350/g.17775 Transcript_23350/m.17775 type:complete len:101 (+) Transcript_23350:243-545(+)
MELLGLSLILHNNHWLVSWSILNLEGPKLDIFLHLLLRELSSNQSLGIEDSVGGVSRSLVLCSISNKSLVFSEGHIRRSGVVSLIILDDLHLVIHPDTNT